MESPPPQFIINEVEDDHDSDFNDNLLTPRSRVNSFTLRLEYDDNCAQCKKAASRRSYRCRQCRHKCKRQCSARNASFKSKAGDTHWTKYLKTSEENSHLMRNGSRLSIHRTCSCSRHGPFSSRSPKDSFFTSLYTRFTDWMASKKDSSTRFNDSSASYKCSKHRKQNKPAERPCSFSQTFPEINALATSSEFSHFQCQSPVSSNCSDYDYMHLVSSSCSSFTVISTPTCSGVHTPSRQYYSSALNSPDSFVTANVNRTQEFAELYPDFILKLLEWRVRDSEIGEGTDKTDSINDSSSSIGPLSSKRVEDQPTLRKRRQSTNPRTLERQKSAPLWKTWPSIEQENENNGHESVNLLEISHDCEVVAQTSISREAGKLTSYTRTESQQSESEQRDPLTEFSIAYEDLQFGTCVRRGETRNIFTGKWHGDVMIHCYHDVNEEERCNFWRTVSQLGKIRHENVVLYMGACLEEPQFAVVTSIRKGISLYDHLHIKEDKSTLFLSLHVARQISQAMGYLHAKGVVVETLCSRNINLEPKVKLCLMDHSFPETKYRSLSKASLPRGNLSYVAPELLRTSIIDKSCLTSRRPPTEMSDVYAFGTLLYELTVGKFPLASTSPECLIYQVCSGKRACLKHITMKSNIKNLIKRCWCQEPMKRPEFEEVSKTLQLHGSIHKKQSSSDPESLHKTGLQRLNYSHL